MQSDIEKIIAIIQENKIDKTKEIKDFHLYDYILKTNNHTFSDTKEQFVWSEDNYFGVMFSLKQHIQSSIDEILIDKYLTNVVTNDFSDNVSSIIYTQIVNFYLSKCITFEEKIFLDDDTELSFQLFIVELSNSVDWILYFFEKYPVLYYSISSFIENQVNYLKEILNNIKKDKNELETKLKIDGKLICVELFKGDLHNENRSVSYLKFEKGCIFYKPRNFDIENTLKDLIEQSNSILALPFFLAFDDYGYVEEVINHQNEITNDKNRTSDYFFEIGKCLKTLFQFKLEDVINDNVIYANERLYLIDIESILIPNDLGIKEKQFIVLDDTPIATGAFPARYGVEEFCNSIFLPSKIKNDGKVRYNSIKNETFFTHTFAKSEYDKHLPSYYYIHDYEHYLLCINNLFIGYNEIGIFDEQITDKLNLIDNCKTRVIFRETLKYFELITHLRSPNFLCSADNYLKELAVILPKEEDSFFDKTVLQSEYRQIFEGDIPFFHISSGCLWDNQGIIYQNAYNNRKNNTLNINFDGLLYEHLILHLPDEFIFEYYFSEIQNTEVQSEQKIIKDRIIKFILSHLHQFDQDKFNWINVYVNNDRLERLNRFVLDVLPMKSGLFDGIDGMIYFLFKYGEKDRAYQIKNFIDWYVNKSDVEYSETEVSIFNQNNSKIISFFSVKEYCSEFNTVIQKFENYLINVLRLQNYHYNLITGISSTMVFILNNKSYFSDKFVYKFIEMITEKSIGDMSKLLSESYNDTISKWNIQSELSGLLLTLNALKSHTFNPTVEQAFDVLRNKFENNLSAIDFNQKHINVSWLTGINGITALCLVVKSKKCIEFLHKYYNVFNSDITYNSFSLSGGNLGTFRLLEYISKEYNYKAPNLRFIDMFNLHNDNIVKAMLPKGLFNGIVGFLELDENRTVLVPNTEWFKF